MTPQRQEQIAAFLKAAGFADAQLQPLTGDASFRRYVRVVAPGKRAMLMDAPPEKENVPAYLAVAEYLHGRGYSAPEILARDAAAGLVLVEDLGDDSFTAALARDGAGERGFYEAATDVLAEWHARLRADPAALKLPPYDEPELLREARLFSDWYLPQVVGKDAAVALGAEYLALWKRLLENNPPAATHFVHRDYHADNLMWLPQRKGAQRIGLLDFQDALYGDPAYDLVSLLEDARRDVPPELAEAMIARYLDAARIPESDFRAVYGLLGAQRNSKIVGIFVRLAARDGKYQYLRHLPRVWRYLERDVEHPALAELRTWLDRHIPASARGEIAIRHSSQELALTA